jgi:hypothetical protein
LHLQITLLYSILLYSHLPLPLPLPPLPTLYLPLPCHCQHHFHCLGVGRQSWLPQNQPGCTSCTVPSIHSFHSNPPIHYGTALHFTMHSTAVCCNSKTVPSFHCALPYIPIHPHPTTPTTLRQVQLRYNTLQHTSVRFCPTVLYRCRTPLSPPPYRTVTLASCLTPTLGRWLISIPSHTRLDQALPAPRFLPTKPVTLHIVYTSPRSS